MKKGETLTSMMIMVMMPKEDEMDTQSSLATKLDDPYLQELLRKKTTNERAACREAKKLEQLSIDSKTYLYEGSGPECNRLDVTLKLLNIKAKTKNH